MRTLLGSSISDPYGNCSRRVLAGALPPKLKSIGSRPLKLPVPFTIPPRPPFSRYYTSTVMVGTTLPIRRSMRSRSLLDPVYFNSLSNRALPVHSAR